MKLIAFVLIITLAGVNYSLWFGEGSLPDAWALKRAVDARKADNRALAQRNAGLAAEVADLKQGLAASEERARSELGMIRRGETFFQVVE